MINKAWLWSMPLGALLILATGASPAPGARDACMYKCTSCGIGSLPHESESGSAVVGWIHGCE